MQDNTQFEGTLHREGFGFSVILLSGPRKGEKLELCPPDFPVANELLRQATGSTKLDFTIVKKMVRDGECRCATMQEFLKCEHYTGPPINDCTYGGTRTVECASIVRIGSDRYIRRYAERWSLNDYAEPQEEQNRVETNRVNDAYQAGYRQAMKDMEYRDSFGRRLYFD